MTSSVPSAPPAVLPAYSEASAGRRDLRGKELWPAVTCLCPTYGRFERLRDALACWLLQYYPGEAELLILNDAPQPSLYGTVSPGCGVRVINAPARYPTLGHKRQALLEAAQTPIVAHWDDDDLYFPWHLTLTIGTLLTRRCSAAAPGCESQPVHAIHCVKPGAAWWVLGPREGPLDVRGIHHNVFEGQMVFDRQRALELGGYPVIHSGQAKALLDAFKRAGELHTWNPPDYLVSYVYRWADGADHVSARKGQTQDQDFGDGRPLIEGQDLRGWARARLHDQFRAFARGVQAHVGKADAQALIGALRAAVAPPAPLAAVRPVIRANEERPLSAIDKPRATRYGW